jgi:hypothetical protein
MIFSRFFIHTIRRIGREPMRQVPGSVATGSGTALFRHLAASARPGGGRLALALAQFAAASVRTSRFVSESIHA